MPLFDGVEMAKQTLGKNWPVATGREHEFVAAFADFLGNSHVGTIGSYKVEKILFVQESIEKDRAHVNTRFVPAKGDATAVIIVSIACKANGKSTLSSKTVASGSQLAFVLTALSSIWDSGEHPAVTRRLRQLKPLIFPNRLHSSHSGPFAGSSKSGAEKTRLKILVLR